MAGAMKYVVADFVAEESENPDPPGIVEAEDRELVKEGEETEDHRFRKKSDDDVAYPHGKTGGGVLDLVEVAAHEGGRDGLKGEEEEKTGDGEDDEFQSSSH